MSRILQDSQEKRTGPECKNSSFYLVVELFGCDILINLGRRGELLGTMN